MSISTPLKTLLLLTVNFAVTLTSCGGGDSALDGPDTATYTATSDSLSTLMGQVTGYRLLEQLEQYKALEDSTYSIPEFIDGLAVTLDRRHPLAYVYGTSMGMQIGQDLDKLEDAGFRPDRKKILESFSEVIGDTTLTAGQDEINTRSEKYVTLTTRLINAGPQNVDARLMDSVQTAYVNLVGRAVRTDISRYETAEQKKYDIPQFAYGLRKVASERRGLAFIAGVYQASMIAQQMAAIEKKGVNIRPESVLAALDDILSGKTRFTEADYEEASRRFSDILQRVDKTYYDAEDRRLAQTDEAIQNVKTGEALVAEAIKANPEIKTTDTGLSYVIYVPGAEPLIGDADTVRVSYTGSHLDGKVFDIDKNAVLVTAKVIPGLREGLKMLGKGGKATFWIPGQLGYGGHGAQSAGIGPMETIVYDIEILDNH